MPISNASESKKICVGCLSGSKVFISLKQWHGNSLVPGKQQMSIGPLQPFLEDAVICSHVSTDVHLWHIMFGPFASFLFSFPYPLWAMLVGQDHGFNPLSKSHLLFLPQLPDFPPPRYHQQSLYNHDGHCDKEQGE